MKRKSQGSSVSSTKEKTIKFKFTVAPYPIDVFVLLTSDDSAIKLNLLDYGVDLTKDVPDALTTEVVDKGLMVAFKSNSLCWSTVAHESFHAANKILKAIGFFKWPERLDEPVAYLMDQIFSCIELKIRASALTVRPSEVIDLALKNCP